MGLSRSRAVPRSRSKSRAVPRSRSKSRAVPRSRSKSRAVPRSRSKSRAVPRSRSKSRAVPRSRSKSRAVPRSRSKTQVNTLTHTIQDMQLNHKYLQSQVQVALARGHFSTPDLVATSNPIHQDDSEPTVLDSTSDMDPTIPYSVQGIVIRRTDLENPVTILTTQTSSLEVTGPGPNRRRRRKK
uniref:Uncharacterized protein n=1 Tax=Leptobrachium leishanense TaxID=445787 RepID=A0A8C5WKY4_9ANUR